MRSKSATWFECKIRYDKVDESGVNKATTETYVVDALTFTDAEKAIIKEMEPFISGEFEFKGITKASYKEVFFSDDTTADKWFKVKLQFITLDEKTGKEKKSSVTYILQSDTFNNAVTSISDVMKGSMMEYVTANVQETPIMDVYEHEV